MRTGAPLRVLNTSPDGMLVETPVRLLPGRRVDVVLQAGTSHEHARWLVVHSRVGCLRGSSDLRYRAGLYRSAGMNYSLPPHPRSAGNSLPADSGAKAGDRSLNPAETKVSTAGTGIGTPEHS